jgi:hypothetical protein
MFFYHHIGLSIDICTHLRLKSVCVQAFENRYECHKKSAVDNLSYFSLSRKIARSVGVLLSLGKDLLLESVWLGETKSDLVGGELVIAVHNAVKLVLHGIFIEWVQHNFLVFLTVKGNSDGFSSDV